jgi:hypothetical protein
MVTGTAGFDPDHRRCKFLEERHHLLAPQFLAQNRYTGDIHPMELKNVLRRIHPNSANLFHGRSPLFEINTRPHSGTVDAAGGRPHQQNQPFLGYTGARKPPAREGRISARRLSGGETTRLPGSGAPGLGALFATAPPRRMLSQRDAVWQ